MLKDLTNEPLGIGEDGKPVWLGDVWPRDDEIRAIMKFAANAETFRRLYSNLTKDHLLWNMYHQSQGRYITGRNPPISPSRRSFRIFRSARAARRNPQCTRVGHIWRFGNDRSHQSCRFHQGYFARRKIPAGKWRIQNDFNSYGARRGNHEVMMRGTFANVRIKNLMIPGSEGGSRCISRMVSK